MEKQIQIYLKRIKALISLNSIEEKEFIKQLNQQIHQSYEESEFHDYDSLVSVYGTPNEVASSYLETQDPDRFVKYWKTKKYIAIIILVAILAIVLVSGVRIYRLNQFYDEFRDSSNLHEETTIVENTNINIEKGE